MKQIRSNKNWDRILRPLAISVSLILLFVVSVFIKAVFFDSYPDTITMGDIDLEAMDKVLDQGFIELESANYREAQCEFTTYLQCFPNDVRAAFGFTTSLVSQCELDQRYCESATLYLEYAKKVSNDDIGLMYEGSRRELESRMDLLPY